MDRAKEETHGNPCQNGARLQLALLAREKHVLFRRARGSRLDDAELVSDLATSHACIASSSCLLRVDAAGLELRVDLDAALAGLELLPTLELLPALELRALDGNLALELALELEVALELTLAWHWLGLVLGWTEPK